MDEQPVEGGIVGCALLDLVEVGGHGRCGGELDQRLEEVERIVVAALGRLVVVGALIELRQGQR